MMLVDSDGDFDPIDDFELVDSEDEPKPHLDDTPASTPPSTSGPRCRQKTLKCPWEQCDKSFNRQSRLTEHLRSHTNTRPFTCLHPHCGKSFLRDNHLKRHTKSAHSEVRDYKCSWSGCVAKFVNGTRLRRHLESHEEKEKFRCRGWTGCSQTFRKQETLDRHILSFHQNIKPFPCPEIDSATGKPCTKAYDTAENLRTHQKAKHDSTRFSCTDCADLNATILDENPDVDPLSLTVASFATYLELQYHIRTLHPPTCPHCPTSFKTGKELTRHLEIQHGILPKQKEAIAKTFPCTHQGCGKVFSKRGNLNVHSKTVHENQRGFVCGKTEVTIPVELSGESHVALQGCNRSFTSKASLEEHVRTAHLGLESKRTLREKKRKIPRSVEDDEDDDPYIRSYEPPAFKRRRIRSDKGTKTFTALDGLTGQAPAAQSNRVAADGDTGCEFAEDMDEDNDVGMLSGSMIIYGSDIWHRGNSYHYQSGEYPTLGSSGGLHDNVDPNLDMSVDDDCASARNSVTGMDFEVVDEALDFGEPFEPEQHLFLP